MYGSLVWKEFNSAIVLKTIIRQSDDQNYFKGVLRCLREYKLTQQNATCSVNFQWEELRKLYGESFIKELDRDGLSVFPTHNDEWLHNKSNILELNDENPIKSYFYKQDNLKLEEVEHHLQKILLQEAPPPMTLKHYFHWLHHTDT
jgi:hypothetical protein